MATKIILRFFLAFTYTFSIALIAQEKQPLPEQEIQINFFVKGTLLEVNKENAPLVIIIPGSGPTNRDGNQKMMRNNSLKQLAEKLYTNGISTFRYDKRAYALLTQEGDFKEEDVSFDDFVTDATSAINYFKEKKYENIILLGHSQGALIAALAAQKSKVSKLISLSGGGQPIDQVILTQIENQAPGLKENAEQAFKDLKNNGKAEKFSPALMSILRPSIQPFMRSWMQYDPAKEIKKIDIPILIIAGTKDLQVPKEESRILHEAKPEATFVFVEDMNHVLKEIKGDELENSKSYNEAYRKISPTLISEITKFIKN